MNTEIPIVFIEDKRARIAISRRRSIEQGIFDSFGNGRWGIRENVDEIKTRMGERTTLVRKLRRNLSEFQPEDTSLRSKLEFVEKLARSEADKAGRSFERQRSWKYGYNGSINFLRSKLKEAYFETSDPRLTLPASIDKMAQTIANTLGRAIAWERIYDLEPFYDKRNPYMPYVRLYENGVAQVRFGIVEEEGRVTDEKVVLHVPTEVDGQSALACIVEGDRKISYTHSWEGMCHEIKPLRPNAPKRYIY